MQGDLRVIVVGTDRDEIPRGVTHVLCLEDHRVVAQGPRQAVLNGDAAREAHRRNHARLTCRFVAASQRNEHASQRAPGPGAAWRT